VGKTTLGSWLRDDLDFLHLEIDRWDSGRGDGIDLEGLRGEWNAFWSSGDARRLAEAIRGRVAASENRGAVLTFASPLVLTLQQISAAADVGIRVLILFGSEAECLESFLRRENASGRRLDANHWRLNNAGSYARFRLPEYGPYRVMAFQDGRFRDRETLVAEVRGRVG
jgi:hypothetical protein